jgi:hypothetical protein
MVNIPKIRRLGCDSWTEEDFKEEGRRNKINRETDLNRRQALIIRGWELHSPRCSYDQHGSYCTDPITNQHLSYKEAYRIQEEREPGSIPKWPEFSNDWTPPPSNEFLIHQEEFIVQPMKVPSSLIFYMDFTYPRIGIKK